MSQTEYNIDDFYSTILGVFEELIDESVEKENYEDAATLKAGIDELKFQWELEDLLHGSNIIHSTPRTKKGN